MKKAQITVSYDEEKLAAITMYLEEKGVSVEREIENSSADGTAALLPRRRKTNLFLLLLWA